MAGWCQWTTYPNASLGTSSQMGLKTHSWGIFKNCLNHQHPSASRILWISSSRRAPSSRPLSADLLGPWESDSACARYMPAWHLHSRSCRCNCPHDKAIASGAARTSEIGQHRQWFWWKRNEPCMLLHCQGGTNANHCSSAIPHI